MTARRLAGLVLAVALLSTGCDRPAPAALPTPAAPARVDCQWHVTLQSFPGMDATITPPVTVPAQGHQTMTITTNLGVVTVDIDLARTPCTAASMEFLAGKHVFDGAPCPVRDPTDHTLRCGPDTPVGYAYPAENLPGVDPAYQSGDVALVDSGQILFLYGPSQLRVRYPRFGRVLTGLDALAPHANAALTLRSVTVGPVH